MADTDNFKKGDKVIYLSKEAKVLKVVDSKVTIRVPKDNKILIVDKDDVSFPKSNKDSKLSDHNDNKNGGNKKMKKMSKFSMWNRTFVNSLPDSSFACIQNGGKKDDEGKTVPRSLRKLPFIDNDGKIDVPHLRNSLAMVSSGDSGLATSEKVMAMSKLESSANKFLEMNKETKSGIIMSEFISKFEGDSIDKLSAIIDVLKDKARNKKPEEELPFQVKSISSLIQDLEEVVELEKAKLEAAKDDSEESKDKKDKDASGEEESSESDKKDEKDEEETEDSKDESKDKKDKSDESDKAGESEEEEEESKFEELVKVCDGYRVELETSEKLVSKFKKEAEDLRKVNAELSGNLSKFKKDSYTKLLNETVEKVSKFKSLNSKEKLDLKAKYLESKMSESALGEVGRIVDDQVMSKLEEPKPTTKPTEMLDPVETSEKPELEFSKMSNEDKLDVLANAQAKLRGFVK